MDGLDWDLIGYIWVGREAPKGANKKNVMKNIPPRMPVTPTQISTTPPQIPTRKERLIIFPLIMMMMRIYGNSRPNELNYEELYFVRCRKDAKSTA